MKFRSCIISIVLGALLILLPVAEGSAFTDAELQKIHAYIEELETQGISFSQCRDQATALYDAKTVQFLSFLEGNFQNKSSTEALTKSAIVRYHQYKKDLRGIFASVRPSISQDSLAVDDNVIEEYRRCAELTESYITLVKEVMISHIHSTQAIKKTTIMVEKYQALNNEMARLNTEMARMYSFFVTFRNKLPGFVNTECVQRNF